MSCRATAPRRPEKEKKRKKRKKCPSDMSSGAFLLSRASFAATTMPEGVRSGKKEEKDEVFFCVNLTLFTCFLLRAKACLLPDLCAGRTERKEGERKKGGGEDSGDRDHRRKGMYI